MDGSTEDHQEPNTRNGGGNPRTVSASNSIRRPSSRPLLDLSGTAIQGNSEDENPTILSGYVSHLALDIGGSLIKLIYFSRDEKRKTTDSGLDFTDPNTWSYSIRGGRLHFVKFETSKINECLDFINSNRLHCGGIWSYPLRGMYSPHWKNPVIKATGGGAHKYSDLFKERLGVTIDKQGEMNCLVAGANFLLKAIRHEAFTHMEGKKEFVQIDSNDLYPYLLVNIGSGVSIIKVDGEGVFERVSGTCLGGGTYWGLGKLLTNLKSFDDQLELSQRGDNRTIDMLVGDIYGGNYDNKLGLPPWTIASSFAKIAAGNNDPKDYVPEDLSLSLLRMISYNIGQISYLNAKLFKIKRIFFGGYFIRGHAYTMDTISFAVNFWSKGQVQAMFLSHEGFLGAIGAFTSYEGHELNDAPYTVGDVHGLPLGDLNKKFVFFMNELSRILKSVQWEEMIGAQKKLGGCGQYSWTDPPSIKNCTQTIPGLLKTINSNVAELKETNKKVATMEKTIQKLWIGLGASFVALLISILV